MLTDVVLVRLLAAVACTLAAIAPAFGQNPVAAAGPDADTIVECRLPGAVRKLGTGVTYLTPGRVVKETARVCEVRGGEYVMYDRADPATALKIWKASAEQGDANAQFRVGQIYEMGIGTAPDYAAAASWYKKAADQGNRAAAFNLAVLHEKGQGVPRDQTAALNLYRKAQGLTGELVSDNQVRALRESLDKAQERIRQLEREIQRSRQSGTPSAQQERDLEAAREELRQILARSKQLPIGLAVDDGKGSSKPTIQLLDPSLVATRGNAAVSVREEVKSRQIVGRVKSSVGVASTTVNGKGVELDRYGVFESSVAIDPNGTPVTIVAVDKQGQQDQLTLELRSRKAGTEAPPAPAAMPAGAFGNYHALVIGNDNYRSWDPLRTAVNDANAVADLLRRKYAFKTKVLLNATHDDILNALNDYVKTLTENDNLLIYYAGHGMYDAGRRGYWIPVDADRDKDTRWILDVQVTDKLLKMGARKVLVVADSCYSGALAAAVPTFRTDIPDELRWAVAERLATVPSRTLLTSGGLQPVWDSGTGKNSVFASAFLDVLVVNETVLEGHRLSDEIEGRVIKASQKIREREERLGRKTEVTSDQIPVYAFIEFAGNHGGDFFFVPAVQ